MSQISTTAAEVAGLDDGEHPLLALARHDLDRAHRLLPARNGSDVDVHAEPCPRSGLAGGAGEPGPAQVLDADDEAGVEQGETGLDEPLFLVGIADLNTGPFVGIARVTCAVTSEAGGGEHAYSADPVAAR